MAVLYVVALLTSAHCLITHNDRHSSERDDLSYSALGI